MRDSPIAFNIDTDGSFLKRHTHRAFLRSLGKSATAETIAYESQAGAEQAGSSALDVDTNQTLQEKMMPDLQGHWTHNQCWPENADASSYNLLLFGGDLPFGTRLQVSLSLELSTFVGLRSAFEVPTCYLSWRALLRERTVTRKIRAYHILTGAREKTEMEDSGDICVVQTTVGLVSRLANATTAAQKTKMALTGAPCYCDCRNHPLLHQGSLWHACWHQEYQVCRSCWKRKTAVVLGSKA